MTTRPFERVLVANRGEIALRVIRAVREAGLESVAVYSEADASAPHARAADHAVAIGPARATESYLRIERLLEAAASSGADAVHPGYGFLSENADFVDACVDAGLVFIGPDPDAVRRMGNKAEARRLMLGAGVPCVPGFDEDDGDDRRLAEAAIEVGFPLMLKAAAGGGGRGMRRVAAEAELERAITSARGEAAAAFGNDELIVERLVESGRHVEVQVLADAHGNTVHLAERDCSLQRRHQKVIEEAPSPAVDADLRSAMGAAACRAAQAVDYRGAGTVEFLLGDDGRYHFLEMNTRIQVEHPVTECVTGVDLVGWQLRIARGDALDFTQSDVRLDGHAVEARLYAENPGRRFLPSPGRVVVFRPAEGPGIRTDGGVESGSEVSPHYDPMIAKVIAHGPDRASALHRLRRALEDTVCFGPQTNRAFLADMLEHPVMLAGEVTTDFLDALTTPHSPGHAAADGPALAIHGALAHYRSFDASRASPELRDFSAGGSAVSSHHHVLDGKEHRRLVVTPTGEDSYRVSVGDDGEHRVRLVSVLEDRATVQVDGRRRSVSMHTEADGRSHIAVGRHTIVLRPAPVGVRQAPDAGSGVVASTPGRVVEMMVAVGERIAAGQRVAIIESMKMRHDIRSTHEGQVAAVHASTGDQVAEGDRLVAFDEDVGGKP